MKLTALLALSTVIVLTTIAATEPAPASPMQNSIPAGFHSVALAPAGRDFLHSRIALPDDFKVSPLPEEEHDFSQPTKFMPLGVAMTTYGPLVFAAAARPAYEDGAVSQWLAYLCKEEHFEAGEPEIVQIGALQGVAVDALQVGDGITMKMRLVLIENGGRLFQLTAMAPVELYSAVESKMKAMLATFEINEVREPRAALFPGTPVPTIAGAVVAPSAAKISIELGPVPAESTTAVAESAPAAAPTARLTDAEFSELVLAPDASALDPEQTINANLRNRGVGLTARILGIDAQKKAVRVGAGAVEGVFTVPFGWHVIDDGRRTLVFDGGGKMQINLSLRSRNGEALATLGHSYLEDYLAKQPDAPVFDAELDGMTAVGIRGVDVDGEILDQVFFLRELPGREVVLVARVTGKADDIGTAMNLAGDIVVRMETAGDLVASR